MEYSDFTNFLNARIGEKNLSIKRLSELTGISIKNIEGIFSGDPKRLPSSPYLKGYLLKLGEVLDFNSDEVWGQMRKFSADKSSGKMDELPKNRFSKKPIGKYLVIGIIAAILVIYFGFRFYAISGTPNLTISYPSENMIVIEANYISMHGKVTNSDKLTVNGEKVDVQSNGNWEKTITSLNTGINPVEITAKKFLGREIKVIRQIIYQASTSTVPQTGPANTDILKTN